MQNNSAQSVNPPPASGWDLKYITRKFSVTEACVRKAMTIVGDSRLAVENYIRRQQMKGRLT